MSDTDLDLLRRFVKDNSQDAFSSLVREHLDFVYSAALRQVRSPDLAAEVCQSVFADLAREAARLRPDSVLGAWLYRVTRRTAIDLIRRESRRQARERLAAEMNAMNASPSDWSPIEPLLEEAMDSLDETDRTAVLLRFFQNKSLREVGAALGTSDDAAQKRVSRAVDKLREFFDRRGVSVGSGALGALIAANAVQAAPGGLALTVSASAGATVLAAAAHVSTVSALTTTITMTTLQKVAIGTAVGTSLGFGIFEAWRAASHRAAEGSLRQERDSLNAQIDQLRQEAVDSSNRLWALRNEAALSGSNNPEVLRLRAEITRLHQQMLSSANATKSTDRAAAAPDGDLDRVRALKAWLAQNPGAGIPELQLVTEQDWRMAIPAQNPLKTERDCRVAMSNLRRFGEQKFIPKLQAALKQYLSAHNGQYPTDLSQLQLYFNPTMDPAILDRWEIVRYEASPNTGTGKWVVTQKAPVDAQFDMQQLIEPDRVSFTPFRLSSLANAVLGPAISAYYAATGKVPSEPADLVAYVTTEAERRELQKQTIVFQQLSPEQRANLLKQIQQTLVPSNASSSR